MLRTNQQFLSYIQKLFDSQDNIILSTLEKERVLFRQGEKTTKVMIIKSGITKCFFLEENGKEFIVEFLGEGEIIGEIEAIKNTNCLCSIEAITELQVFQIPIPYFKELMNTDIFFNRLLIEAFSERIINTSSRAAYQQLYNSERSLSKLLDLLTQQNLKISKNDMAAYLGISLRSLNRLMKSLR